MLLRENFSSILVVGAILCACALWIALQASVVTSPIVNAQRLPGTIETVLMQPANPKTLVSVAVRYKYGIRLHDNGTLVFIDVRTPQIVGSEVSLEQQHRENGADTYRLLDN